MKVARAGEQRKGIQWRPLEPSALEEESRQSAEQHRTWLLLGGRLRSTTHPRWASREAGQGIYTKQVPTLSPHIIPTPLGIRLKYLADSPAQLESSLLPMLAAAYALPTVDWTELCPRLPASTERPDLFTYIQGLLDAVASVLIAPEAEDYPMWDAVLISSSSERSDTEASTSQAPQQRRHFNHLIFEHPPMVDPARQSQAAASGPNVLCLRIDPRQLDRRTVGWVKHMWQWQEAGYLRLQLGKHRDAKETSLKEWAHRIVNWAARGPPPVALGPHAVTLHICNTPDCMNPQHMAWGSRAENVPRV